MITLIINHVHVEKFGGQEIGEKSIRFSDLVLMNHMFHLKLNPVFQGCDYNQYDFHLRPSFPPKLIKPQMSSPHCKDTFFINIKRIQQNSCCQHVIDTGMRFLQIEIFQSTEFIGKIRQLYYEWSQIKIYLQNFYGIYRIFVV